MSFPLFQFGGVGPFSEIVNVANQFGFFLYLFPFLLALALIYGALKYSLGGMLPKSAIGLISLVLAFFVMLYSNLNPMIVQFFARLSGAGLIVGSGVLFVVILLGLIGFKIERLTEDKDKRTKWIFILAIILIAILIFFGAGAGQFGLVPSWSTTSQFWAVLFVIIIIALALFWITSEEGGKKE